jgi:hypothetical protein
MAQVTLNVPDAAIDALARKYGYDPATDGVKGAFVKAKVIQGLKTEVKEYLDYEARAALVPTPEPDIT